MHKKVLLAEQSDATRSVAETVLRRNGYEVISVRSGEKALEVLSESRPDIMIIGEELQGHTGLKLYQCVHENKTMATIPMLLLTNSTDPDLPFPQEIIIPRPVDSKDLIEKANIFSGQSTPESSSNVTNDNPLGEAELDDEILDAALGLDEISITESEVMNQTKGVPISQNLDDLDKSGHVESIMVSDTQTDIRRSKTKKRNVEQPSSTGKLDILQNQNQYGIDNIKSESSGDSKKDHDYDWFINEMQQDVNAPPSSSETSDIPDKNDQKLTFEEPSKSVDPVTPFENSDSPFSGKSEGVDKFIDEFKREVEKFQSDESESVSIETKSAEPQENVTEPAWEETFERVTPQQIELFTQQLAQNIGENIARIIIDKIDSNKLMNLIKDEIVKHIRQS